MDYEPKTVPFAHQARTFAETRDLPGWALFWEQGTGKTKPTIDTVAYQYLKGNIDALIVVAPPGVHLNWVTDELPAHMPDRVMGVTSSFVWRTASAGTKRAERERKALLAHEGLAVLTIPYDSFTTKACKAFVWEMFKKRKVFFVADEGIYIKTPGAMRTMSIVKAAQFAKFRRLLNGTPVAGEPWDVFTQMKFVDNGYWKEAGLDDYYMFKHHFGIWKKIVAQKDDDGKILRPEFEMCTTYRRLDKLKELLQRGSDRVLKDDVLDLPQKIYSKARFELTPKQRRHYEDLKIQFMTWMTTTQMCQTCGGTGREECSDGVTSLACEPCEGTGFAVGGLVTAELAITRILRLQQITAGYLPTEIGSEEPFHVFDENPRLDRFMTLAESLSHSCITWVRFQKDAELLCAALKKAGLEAVRYDGTVPEALRAKNKAAFQKGDAQFFIANPAAIATGITLTIAKTTAYYTNSYNLIHRLQSEDRNHRIGQDQAVNYVDLIADQTVDEPIVKALRDKVDVSRQVTGDRFKEWI